MQKEKKEVGKSLMAAGRKKEKKKWDREEILDRLMRIAEDARASTFQEKIDRNGEKTVGYDAKCASIELKAIEFAVKLTGMLEEEKDGSIVVDLSDELKELAQ